MSNVRIGLGEDIHRLVEGRKLVLGGVEIPFEKGLEAHSDGDVVYHAVSDAILGAAALGDIGRYFKVNDPKWDNAPSKKIVQEVVTMIEERGFHVVNVSIVLLAEEPHLAQYIEGMRVNLAFLLHIDATAVNVAAGTMEGCGPVGAKEAIEARAVALLERGNEEKPKWTTKKR